jgi:hypothetical protein
VEQRLGHRDAIGVHGPLGHSFSAAKDFLTVAKCLGLALSAYFDDALDNLDLVTDVVADPLEEIELELIH